MAACSIGGASSIKVFAFCSDFGKADRTKGISLERFSGPRLAPLRHEPVLVAGLGGRTKRSANSFLASCGSLPGRNDTEEDISVEKKERRVPDSSELESLLTTVCDTTSIAEFKLNLAGFRLYVKRDLVDKDIPQPASTLPVVQVNTSNQTPDSNGSASTTSLAIMNSKSPSGGIQNILNTASDEGLVILQSPKVGFFRRSRTIKGKRAPPSCKEKQQVKEGQVLCFIEQLGGNIPIESDVSGEVVKILRKDGEPVGYGDALIAILPSFPGIKKLQ